MISFDVVSLNNTTWQTRTQLNTQDMLDLLDLCLSTEFCFQNNYYRQISGIPMGSPLSSFLAEAVMQELESKAVTNNNDIKTWDRYVDDVFATVKKDKTEDVLQTINNTTNNIKFTKEEEHDNKLAFLDVLITKADNGTLNTEVYRKKTHTDQILNYNSNHPTQHKISCIKTLFNRIDTHCNTEQSKQDERTSTYTPHSTRMTIPEILSTTIYHVKIKQTLTNTKQSEQTKTRITLPYIHTTSEMTARLRRPFNIEVAHKPTCKLRSNFTKNKDKTNATDKRNAIYMFPCKNCPEKYIGKTSKKTGADPGVIRAITRLR